MSNNIYKSKHFETLTVILPSSKTCINLKADLGANKTYIRPQDKEILQQQKSIENCPQIKIPNGMNMRSIQSEVLPLHQLLTTSEKQAIVLKGLSNSFLLSIGQLCDNDCIAIFDKRHLHVYKWGQCVLKGMRNWLDGLWDINITKKIEQANMIIRKDRSKTELAENLHKCAFSPSLSTFQRAIWKGRFLTWPGITSINFKKFVHNLVPTAKGHLDQERANLQSTKNY